MSPIPTGDPFAVRDSQAEARQGRPTMNIRPWYVYCHWCAMTEATQGCNECKHIFCDGCWHPTLGCPRCYGESIRRAKGGYKE